MESESSNALSADSFGLLPTEQAKLERFSAEFTTLRPDLMVFLVGRTGGDMGGAEDCLQEVAVVLWKKHDPDWSSDDFRRYAFRCAGIEAQAFLRKRKHSGQSLQFLAPDMIEEIGNVIIERAEANPTSSPQRLRALQQCIDLLDLSQRELLDARYEKERNRKSLSEIAIDRGHTIESLYKRLERLRNALHRCIVKRLKQSSP